MTLAGAESLELENQGPFLEMQNVDPFLLENYYYTFELLMKPSSMVGTMPGL